MKSYILLLVILLVGCQNKKDDNAANTPSTSTEVTLTKVKKGNIESTITLSGTTVYQRKTTMSAPVACYIVQTLVSPGDIVKQGQTLFIMESKESRALGENVTLEKLNVKANKAGLVTEVMQQSGSYTPEGTPLCTIADLSSMVFEINVPYEQQHNIRKGSFCDTAQYYQTKHISRQLWRNLYFPLTT